MSTGNTSEYVKAYDQAIKYLGLRAHTEFELRAKLARKKFGRAAVDAVVAELKSKKYLDDEAFARTFVQNLAKYKTFGYYGIRLKLQQRGVDRKLADAILADEVGAEAEEAIARRALAKSAGKPAAKRAAMLARKGFRSQAISRLVGDCFFE